MTAETTVPPAPKAPADKAKKARAPRAKAVKKTDDVSAAPASTRSPQAAPRAKKPEASHRLRIKVRAYEHGVLDGAVKQIIDVASRHNATVIGPVPLPIDIRKYTVNRAAFIDKDSREQFEMRIHKRMIDILNPEPKVIEALTNIDLPSGVSIDVKMM
jgi:small subunit ribosomal protein S10